jgi:hypothetical protein
MVDGGAEIENVRIYLDVSAECLIHGDFAPTDMMLQAPIVLQI